MMLFHKPLVSLTAANLFVMFVSIAPRAETIDSPETRIGRVEAQITAARNETFIAQGYGRPPEDLYPGEQPQGGQQDPAGLLVRISRLESQMRQINGQIEQMQFETRKLEEQIKKFQEDIDFRLRDRAPGAPVATPPQKRGEATEPQINGDYRSSPQTQSDAAVISRAARRGDAFDPSQNPAAPGAPRPLGNLAPAATTGAASGGRNEGNAAGLGHGQNDPGAPLDLSQGRFRAEGTSETPTPPLDSARVPPSRVATPAGTVIAVLPNSPKEEFDIALAYLKQKAYENAEKGFAGFLEKNSKDKMASDATFYLGESFYLRGRQREAAEQYLKVSTQFANSPRAPQALLRLGQSLNTLGAKEQACASFNEIGRKYPTAPAMIKTGAEREAKRAQC